MRKFAVSALALAPTTGALGPIAGAQASPISYVTQTIPFEDQISIPEYAISVPSSYSTSKEVIDQPYISDLPLPVSPFNSALGALKETSVSLSFSGTSSPYSICEINSGNGGSSSVVAQIALFDSGRIVLGANTTTAAALSYLGPAACPGLPSNLGYGDSYVVSNTYSLFPGSVTNVSLGPQGAPKLDLDVGLYIQTLINGLVAYGISYTGFDATLNGSVYVQYAYDPAVSTVDEPGSISTLALGLTVQFALSWTTTFRSARNRGVADRRASAGDTLTSSC